MRQRIEIESLSPNFDPKTLQMTNGVVLCYKDNGQNKILQLDGTQLEIMNMFNIQNFSEVAGKKVDIEFENKDGKQKITGVLPVDGREISYGDLERMEKKIDNLVNILKSHIASEKKTP